jgi:hypothetical protein
MCGEKFPRRALAPVGGNRRRLGGSPLGGDLVLGGRSLQFLERKLHRVEDT